MTTPNCHCPKCGRSWVAALHEVGCPFCRVRELEGENHRYRDKYGCINCGEIHHGGCCPPVEARTTGKAWFGTTQAINRHRALEAENARSRKNWQSVLSSMEIAHGALSLVVEEQASNTGGPNYRPELRALERGMHKARAALAGKEE